MYAERTNEGTEDKAISMKVRNKCSIINVYSRTNLFSYF